jgi:riboflavin synthase
VAKVTDSDFSVSIIPHTAANTTLLQKKSGDVVNLENDVVGKYIEKLLSFQKIDEQKPQSKITEEFLRQNGF